MTSTTKTSNRDRVEILLGACIMGFPAAATGEIWDAGEVLALGHILLFAAASFLILAYTIYVLHGHSASREPSNRRDFVVRLLSTYGLTLAASVLMLFGLGQFDLLEPVVGLKRAIIVAFPASFAATAADSLTPSND